MDEAEVAALVDHLEASYEARDDVAEVARALATRLPAAPWAEPHLVHLTLLDVDGLVHDRGPADAALVVLQIRDRAVLDDDHEVQARAERALSILFREIGDPTSALEHAVAALALDGDDLGDVLRCQLRLVMADALDEHGAIDGARLRYREALERARPLERPQLALHVLNNWAYAELVAGNPDVAGDLVEQLQSLAEEHGETVNIGVVGTIAEVLHVLGRSGEAVSMLSEHLQARPSRNVFDVTGAWLALSRIERGIGALDAAGTSLDTAERLATTHELQGLRVEAVDQRAELLAARGDHAGAYEAHLRFHAQTLEARSTAADARAQTLHAMFEADQARRESARYRELSYRDPLTGLHNRRHVDEDLDRRLALGEAVGVAMVDLDHFKRVNDTCSHDAGDAVLVRLARLLDDAVAPGPPGAHAARLGGEEFLLVLPGADLPAVRAVAETLRQRVAATGWSDVAPGVTVTVSIGLAVTTGTGRPATGRPGLLREADRHLHTAKTGGRDRVEPRADRPCGPPAPQALVVR